METKFSRILKKGVTKGDDVAMLQRKLIELKLLVGSADGDFGPKTDEAVKKYQGQNGLVADGIVGPKTWSKMNTAIVTESRSSFSQSTPKPATPASQPVPQPNVVKVSNFVDKASFYIGKNSSTPVYDYFLEKGEYFEQKTKKNTIYLHHTSGGSNPKNTILGWNSDDQKGQAVKVCTAYVLGRNSSQTGDPVFDGRIYRAFDDACSGYHLGVKHKNNKELNFNSVGIEICCYGYVVKTKTGQFMNYVNKAIPASEVEELEKPFRGYKYWEKYSDTQIASLRELLVYLIDKYDIDIKASLMDGKDKFDADWFEFNEYWLDHPERGGIKTHTNVRTDKTDCYPSPRLIDMLNSLL